MHRAKSILMAVSAACLVGLAPSAFAQPVIIVKDPGKAPANNQETITVQSIIPNPKPPPPTVKSTDTIQFSVAAGDVATANDKSKLIAAQINKQAANVTAKDNGGSVTISPKANNKVSMVGFSPTTKVDGKVINTEEVLRLNPKEMNLGGFVAYDIHLDGTGAGGGLATLDLGDPTNGSNLLAMVSTTTNESEYSILSSLASQINAYNTPLFAMAVGDTLSVTGAMDLGNDNNYIDFVSTDSGFTYDYGVASVPEPSSVVLLGFGAMALAYYVRSRQRRATMS